MNKRVVVSASVTVALALAACGGGSTGPSTSAFSDQMAGICRTINRGIANLDAATSLDAVRKNATDASGLYEDGVNALKKLTIPTSDKQFASDVKDLITSFGDQLDTLDSIAKAAKENDQGTVNTRMAKLTKQAKDSNDLANSLSISRCQLDPVFTTTIDTVPATTPATTATTEPPVPLTLPIATLPPTTVPPLTFPSATTPVLSNKQILSSSDLVPPAGFTFQDVPSNVIESFRTLLELAPSMAAQSGGINGVDLVDSNGQPSGRVFAFASDTKPMTPGSFEEDVPFITSDVPTTPLTIRNLSGLTWTSANGNVHFLVGINNILLWAFATSADNLQFTVNTYLDSLPK